MKDQKEPRQVFEEKQNEPAPKPSGRRIELPPRHKSKVTPTAVIPDAELLFQDAKAIVSAELSQYLSKVKRGVTLAPREAKVVQGYLETLIKLQKEEREQARSADLSNLSDEELMDIAVKVLGSTKPKLIEE